MNVVCMLREVLLMYGYVVIVCWDTLSSPRSPLFLSVWLPLDSLGCQGCWGHLEGGRVPVTLAWADGNGKSLLLGGCMTTPDLHQVVGK